MNRTEYHYLLALLDSAIALFERAARRPDAALRRRLDDVALRIDLLHASIAQPPAYLRRN